MFTNTQLSLYVTFSLSFYVKVIINASSTGLKCVLTITMYRGNESNMEKYVTGAQTTEMSNTFSQFFSKTVLPIEVKKVFLVVYFIGFFHNCNCFCEKRHTIYLM